jgi:hypothetical protein
MALSDHSPPKRRLHLPILSGNRHGVALADTDMAHSVGCAQTARPGWSIRIAAVLLGLMAASCGRVGSASREVPKSRPVSTAMVSPYEPPAAIPEMGIVFDPSGNAKAAVSSEEAIALATEMFPEFASQAMGIYTAFGLFTDSQYGLAAGDEGPVTPEFVAVPAWVVTFDGVAEPAHAPHRPERTPSPGRMVNPEFNIVVDALIGEYMMAWSSFSTG